MIRARDGGRHRADRGLSEVLAFILTFSIILGSVGLLYATGFTAMSDYQEDEQLTNAERAMSALADNFNVLIQYDGLTERNGELSLRDGRLVVDDEGTTMTLEVEGEGTPLDDDHLGSITYEKGQRSIAYEGGGVFRNETSGDVLRERPQLKCEDDVAIVSLVVVEGETGSIQTSGSTQVRVEKIDTDVTTADGNVTVEVDSPSHGNGWESAFDRGEWDDSGGSNEWTCEADRAIVRIVFIEVTI